MTREEAIEELKDDIELYMTSDPILLDRELPDGRLITALEMAIKALEQEPCEDCISREHLLEEIASLKESPWFKDNTNCAMAIRKEAIEIVEDLCIRKEPSVTPHQATCEEKEKGECPFYAG